MSRSIPTIFTPTLLDATRDLHEIRPPMPEWSLNLRNFREYVASKFPSEEEARRYGASANIKLHLVKFSPTPIGTWHSLIEEAMPCRQNKLPRLFDVILQDYPDDANVLAAKNGVFISAPSDLRMDGDKWHGDHETLEKIFGSASTLLPVTFLAGGVKASRSVAKVLVPRRGWSGSGFLVHDDILLTNNHVLPTSADAESAHFIFNFDFAEAEVTVEKSHLDRVFFTCHEHDVTAVRLASGSTERWGALTLRASPPEVATAANIVQHPQGRPKEIGIYRNHVAFANSERVQYRTDTEPGSSGAPVFDLNWEVIALHHSGGWIPEPGKERRFYRNEGISSVQLLALMKQWGLAERVEIND